MQQTAELPTNVAEAREGGEEFREGNGGAIGVEDGGITFCTQGGHGESHGNAVVALGIDLGTA